MKINNYCLCGGSILVNSDLFFKIVNLFFSFDGQKYARYLCYFSLFLFNIVKTHPELLKLDAINCGKVIHTREQVYGRYNH